MLLHPTFRSLLLFLSAGIISIGAASCSLFHSDEARPLAYVRTEAGSKGEFGEPFGIAVQNGIVYVSDGENDCIWRLDQGGPVVFSTGLDTPSAIAFDKEGRIVVADTGSHTIRTIDSFGSVSLLAGTPGRPGADDGDSDSASFNGPIGIAIATDGRIFVADTYNDRIRMIKNGQVTTVAGGARGFTDGVGTGAKFDTPTGISVWNDKLLVADMGNARIRVVEPDGRVWTLAGTGSGDLADGLIGSADMYQPTSIVTDSQGTIYISDGNAIRRIGGYPFARLQTITSQSRGIRDGAIHRSQFNRPSGMAIAPDGSLLMADSENGLIRRISSDGSGPEIQRDEMKALRGDPAAFRAKAEPRWPYDPPHSPRDVAGTLGEIRGEIKDDHDQVWFHNGLDIAGAYGETARFIRDEKVLRPQAAENFGTLRELLRMPTLGYIHIRLGRDQASRPFGDARFLFENGPDGKLADVRVPRGAKFKAGEAIGTLNPMNHVHLIAGRSGYEMNALDALVFPGISDKRQPVIEQVTLWDENWREFETLSGRVRIIPTGKLRVTTRAYDQMDGNSDRRRLGLYRIGYQIYREGSPPPDDIIWTISFDRLPASEFVRLAYAKGSRSGATGVTTFNYIVTNRVAAETGAEEFIDTGALENGIYMLRIHAADYFGNTSTRDVTFEVSR